MRELLLAELKQISGGFPTLIPGFFTDDIMMLDMLIGASAAYLIGYYANKHYNNPTISLKDAASCVASHAVHGLQVGLYADLAWYVGTKIVENVMK